MNVLQAATWEVLPHQECVVGLQSQRVGRIALSADALPVLLPVFYVYDGTVIVFRTQAGSVLDRNCRNTVVAFEVDSHDAGRRAGWSVMAVGVANVVASGDERRERGIQLDRLGAPEGDVIVKIDPGSLTGRAMAPAPSLVITEG
ncbi:MAG TPA: pyridoxamine 5'-phosphate oxidase family protein [Mycobacteriales bacterium]|jgi:nitroimidazol reductase NimA-like FMN-containing flavoprotein (pyridoxamine 5'-phosphate oxidase superfamily)|nr:pyridoxamine 5'-phosphate oxidase family protein [Mycobacteriales bacterium]